MSDYINGNIGARFGARPGFSDFFRAFAANVLGVDSGYPKTASLRASRAFNGSTRIVSLADLDAIDLPEDFPLLSGDSAVPDEAALLAYYQAHFPLTDLPLLLGEGGPGVATTVIALRVHGFAQTGAGRPDVCRLAAARALGLEEIAIEVRWT
jgi:hypothetical protein